MSDDIVSRLQFWKHNSEAYAPHPTWRFHTDLDEASGAIERLREALTLAAHLIDSLPGQGKNWQAIIRFKAAYDEALAEKT